MPSTWSSVVFLHSWVGWLTFPCIQEPRPLHILGSCCREDFFSKLLFFALGGLPVPFQPWTNFIRHVPSTHEILFEEDSRWLASSNLNWKGKGHPFIWLIPRSADYKTYCSKTWALVGYTKFKYLTWLKYFLIMLVFVSSCCRTTSPCHASWPSIRYWCLFIVYLHTATPP